MSLANEDTSLDIKSKTGLLSREHSLVYEKFREHLAEMLLKCQIGVDAFTTVPLSMPATSQLSRQSLSLGHGHLWSISCK
jgi:hypothetical protein